MHRQLQTAVTPRPAAPLPIFDRGRTGPERRASAEADAQLCRVAMAIAAVLMNVDVEEIERPNRSNASICEARHVAMYLAHVVFQVSLIRSGSAFGRDRTSVAHAVRRIEDNRDDPAYDAKIETLERLTREIGLALASGPRTERER